MDNYIIRYLFSQKKKKNCYLFYWKWLFQMDLGQFESDYFKITSVKEM